MQTLVPPPIEAPAKPHGPLKGRLGWALTPRALTLLVAGCLLAVPAFFHPRWIVAMLVWDALVLALAMLDAILLPTPAAITAGRRFDESPVLGQSTRITLSVTHTAPRILEVRLTDALHPYLDPLPATHTLQAFPRDPAQTSFTVTPNTRGDIALGQLFLRYRGTLQLAERWAVANLEQKIRVYPPLERSPENSALYLLRIRQIALQKRRLHLRGIGREFESLREYQRGDELRNVSWTATARRAKVITREFTTERSQQVWIVLDAGRLSRTAFELRTKAAQTSEESSTLQLTQLDQASGAAVALAQTVMQAGDKAALLVYGRSIQQQLPPASGPAHLRQFIDSLAQIRPESAEAAHLAAAARLKHLQRRRSLVLWITELADTARRPEVVDAAADLARRHLVLLILLIHPELDTLARREPNSVEEMFHSAAAVEVPERRRELIVRLRAQGVLVVETTAGSVQSDAINEYLEIKARGLI
ncbi:DUF58 domain-containing protein [Silvibacterium dinghuense]|uniref:DUF58 domain-containing protein n=1 Tax=Silvibacterium dinghuense TaxID=1560006 RepID=A0A4Q1SKT2_9BACT|nr:DUF58 domain-containing protein [Silvibacterium dinghuense]